MDCYLPSFERSLDDLDKRKTYFVYCRTGTRTSQVIRIMLGKGFERIYTSHKDITGWEATGLPLVKGTDSKGL